MKKFGIIFVLLCLVLVFAGCQNKEVYRGPVPLVTSHPGYIQPYYPPVQQQPAYPNPYEKTYCSVCNGTGVVTCMACGGTGVAYTKDYSLNLTGDPDDTTHASIDQACSVCYGLGHVDCSYCHGTGTIN